MFGSWFAWFTTKFVCCVLIMGLKFERYESVDGFYAFIVHEQLNVIKLTTKWLVVCENKRCNKNVSRLQFMRTYINLCLHNCLCYVFIIYMSLSIINTHNDNVKYL